MHCRRLALTIAWSLAAGLVAPIAAPGGALAGPACGTTITGTVKLTADLDCSHMATSPALTLATRAKLDLGGRTVTCAPGGTGLDLANQFAVVSNGRVTGCDTAVRVGGAGRNTVRRLTVDGNDVGIAVTSDRNQLRDNTVVDSESGIILAAGADHNLVEHNHVTGSQGTNILINSDHTLVRNNTASASVSGSGIGIAGDENKLIGNHTAGNGADGVEVLGGVHNKSFKTTAPGNARGIAVHAGAREA